MHNQLAQELKQQSYDLGFDAVGIASATPLALARESISTRVASGLLPDYGFPTKPVETMTTPQHALPGAKSVIAVAMSYLADNNHGSVARFARGKDYHRVLTQKLQQLAAWLDEESGGGIFRICVDTGPLTDRAAAQAAGIGSYGKNCSIIVPEFGSWVVLGEIITDIELIPDEPAPVESCGDCSACIKACPTGAIVQPFVIDQTRCLSHITQMKGSIPEEFRSLLGDRIYGCDTCQEVCPKNSTAKSGIFPMQGGLGANPDPAMLLGISDEDFNRTIKPTAAGWIGRSRIRRNAAVAMGNTGDASALQILEKHADDPDPIIHEHVWWAIGNISGNVTDSHHPHKS